MPNDFDAEIVQFSVQYVSADQKSFLFLNVGIVHFKATANHTSWLAVETINDDLSNTLSRFEFVVACVWLL